MESRRSVAMRTFRLGAVEAQITAVSWRQLMAVAKKTEQRPDLTINAEPTKELFITMLVKDIPLTRAIIDLIDNCIDGARRLRKNRDFEGLWVRLNVRHDHFKISDNCGGIPVNIARQYAFRFGRPKEMPVTLRSVGQFGVGMKRALFKLGTKFTVASSTATSKFLVEVDVDRWKNEPGWEFEFKELEEDARVSQAKRGTTIEVSQLHTVVAADFKLENFQNRLRQEIKEAQQTNLNKKLSITFNGIPLTVKMAELLSSKSIKPAFQEIRFRIDPETGQPSTPAADEVTVRIYVGVGESDPKTAGWFVFCNGRMILGADQTLTTGWGAGRRNPKFHNQYSMFRGYVFFEADNAALLPWNTTKTGVDSDAPSYKSIRLQMIELMQPVITFLNAVDRENEARKRPLHAAIEAAKSVRLTGLKPQAFFLAPASSRDTKDTIRITYTKPAKQVEKVKRMLKTHSYGDVGSQTFDYFYERVCKDNDDDEYEEL
jgi:hypothetical protein